MRRLIWSQNFTKSVKRTINKHLLTEEEIEEALNILIQNPFDSRLRTHKLKGELKGTWGLQGKF
ncbi:MAG: plasmid stabilization protein [Candidatus Atribacteria bacterium]|nr:plasmid stabilization protein [Candidatus Atribacteria bacterium]